MRKTVFGLLLATVATPVLAAGGPGIHFKQDDKDSAPRQQVHVERPARDDDNDRNQNQRPANAQRPQFNRGDNRPVQFERPQFNGYTRSGGQVQVDRREFRDEGRHDRPVMRDNPYTQQGERDRDWRQQPVQGRFSGSGIRFRQPVVSNVPRQGTQPPIRMEGRHSSGIHWNRDWRNDRRYDWRDRRRHHGSLFHIGIYYDPFGWNYQPYSVGYRLWPNYYQQNYWIDPAMYGLPYPPPGTQWVRYWNDALLVDMYSGEVVDVINNFFW